MRSATDPTALAITAAAGAITRGILMRNLGSSERLRAQAQPQNAPSSVNITSRGPQKTMGDPAGNGLSEPISREKGPPTTARLFSGIVVSSRVPLVTFHQET